MFSCITTSLHIHFKAVNWTIILALTVYTACSTGRYVIVPSNEVEDTDNVRVHTLKDGSIVLFPDNSGSYSSECTFSRSTHTQNITIPSDSVKTVNAYRWVSNTIVPAIPLDIVATGLLPLALLHSAKSPVNFEQSSLR